MDIIRDGDRVIFRRNEWCKEGVVGVGKSLMISKLKTKTDSIVGLPYGCLVEWNKQTATFEHVREAELPDLLADFGIDGENVSADNRNLVDDGSAQSLTTEEIREMKSKGITGVEVVENLVQKSATFNQRQEYGKEKYIQKKLDKHMYRFRVLRPNLRLACEAYSGQRALKVNHLRIDVLAIMLSFSNIQHGSRVIVVDGIQGLLLAAAMERTGGAGRIVHIHSGPQPVTPAYNMMGFPESWSETIHHLSIDNLDALSSSLPIVSSTEPTEESAEPPRKRRKLSEGQIAAVKFLKENVMHSLIMSTKLHPKPVLLYLLPYLELSRNFVIHCNYREPLLDTFNALRARGGAVRLCFNDTFMRQYQVLDQRTHPENVMSGHGGFILSGITTEGGPTPENADGTTESVEEPMDAE